MTASEALVKRPHHGLGFGWMDSNRNSLLEATRKGHADSWKVRMELWDLSHSSAQTSQ